MPENFWSKRRIFPSITTIINSNWKKEIAEVKKIKLKEVCLFLTCVNENERKELYNLLKETGVEKIPLIHLRNDMRVEELNYLAKNYKTKIFNTHSETGHPLKYGLGKYKKSIYIENAGIKKTIGNRFIEEEIKNFAGVCLDFSHLENERLLRPEIYESDIKVIEKYPCGCNHIGAVKKNLFKNQYEPNGCYRSHFFEDLSEFDYLKKYPAEYFSSILAIELENTIGEQLKARDYIINLLT